MEPCLGLRRVASNTRTRSLGVITVGFCPGCGVGISPWSRSLKKRFFNRQMLGAVVCRDLLNLGIESGEHARHGRRQTPRNRDLTKFFVLIASQLKGSGFKGHD